ncbi:MAG: spermidine/putrescine ABC transporter ATP-binding protein [Rhizobiales bacterium NRL2]|jgi:putative spermidine/putrescine transport system ATP-binding protein|nr:MAG: spermidine/putrescine ABC transporter ATP-binding protein [Rhizobiales bacterium NRL2]
MNDATATVAAGDPFVSFQEVQKSYDGETLVVKNLNLDIAKGEFLTMLGPSGSGKTTCLMMLAGFETPTHGKVVLDGNHLNNVPPHKRDIGMVFQNYALFPHMTVAENLAFPLRVRRMGRAEIEERVQRALEMVQLPELGHRRPAQLSGGQQQRVAVARALVFDPKLVLMDEPLGALDKQLREQMQFEIKHIHDNLGITVVYVTHDQSEALTMSNRIAVFNDGVIQQLAEPDALYERPDNAFVAQFIGENNKLTGRVESVEGDQCVVTLKTGEKVRALSIGHEGVGSETMLSLRPERVRMGEEAEGCDSRVEGRVEELIYLGDHIRTRMTVCGRDDFVVKIPNSTERAGLSPGSEVALGWRTRDCRALDWPEGL